MKILSCFFVSFLFCMASVSMAEDVDLKKISTIESSNNPAAYNKISGAIGLHQITPICLQEWNNFHPAKKYSVDELYDREINTEIAKWYLNVRIPSMLRHYGKPNTIENRLISYNAGISYVVNGTSIPEETKKYINKYRRMK